MANTNIVNYVFVHDRSIRDLFVQESKRLDSNMLKYCKFVCARDPTLTDFTPQDDVLNVFEEKYKDLNGKIRLQTGKMSILERNELIEPYEYIGFQRCSIIYDFPILDNIEEFDNDKFYFRTYSHAKSHLSVFLDYKGAWQTQLHSLVIPIFNKIQNVLPDSEEARFCQWFMNNNQKRFHYDVAMFANKGKMDIIRNIDQLSLDLWNKIRKLVLRLNEHNLNAWSIDTLDFYNSIQEYFHLKMIGIDNININSMKQKLNLLDDKFHCRGK